MLSIKNVTLLFLLICLSPLHSQGKDYPLPYKFDGKSTLPVKNTKSSLPDEWYQKSVMYEVYVREFLDTDGDGIGDFRGLIKKLDYLEQLGVGAIWMMPTTKSYDRDHGYSVIDYRDVEQDYGTMQEFDLLIKEAHKRNIAVIMDMVVNHCSTFSPQFEAARSNPKSKYRDWFFFSDKLMQWQEPWSSVYIWGDPDIEAIDKEHNRYIWYPAPNGSWYYGLFNPIMPDFNYYNKDVYQFMKDNMVFWLERGVDGFRLDAVSHIFEDGPDLLTHHPLNHHFVKGIRKLLERYNNRFLVVEADDVAYLGNGSDESNAFFDFEFAFALTSSINRQDKNPLIEYFKKLETIPEGGSVALQMSNHDLPLGNRPMTRYNNDKSRAKLAASILLTLPGIPFIYYGEEIGMTNSQRYEFDWNLRTPMQWDSTKNSGFTTAVRPYNRRVNPDYKKRNVQKEQQNDNSMLSHYRRFIHLRNSHAALSQGDFELVDLHPDLVAWSRKYGKESLLVIHNISGHTVTMPLTIEGKAVVEYNFLSATVDEDFSIDKNNYISIKSRRTLVIDTGSL